MLWLLALLATLFAGWRALRRLLFFLHLFQLEGYKPVRFVRWLRAHSDVLLRRSHGAGVLLLAMGVLVAPWLGAFWTPALVLLGWCVAFASSRRYRRDRPKKPLAFTPRMRRLLSVAVLFTLAGPVVGGLLGTGKGVAGWLYYLGGWLWADWGAPLWVLLAGWLLWPVEKAIQEGFKRKARRKLAAHPNLTVIGITGSYGKTSTKFIIAEILSLRYQVLATPGSYNTPMGICKVINEQLRSEHQVLVLEMGIRYPGDIRELCAIAQPDIGVVTAVGPMHLETMGSIEAIAREKSELPACTRPGGPVVLNADDPYVAAMAERARGPVWRVSIKGHPAADLTAHDITYGPEGTRFVVREKGGTEQVFHTQLLGLHNVLDILLAVAVGRIFGLRLRQMAHAVARLRPVEHRLQLRREGSITVIDDAFNANPVGARNALEILGQFRTGRRIVVTPGMVELGEREAEENQALGRFMAQHVDLAVLIGPRRTQPIQKGLREAGFPEQQIRVFRNLFEAQDFLKTYLQPGDVVLYENDLPDQYDES